MTYSKQGNDSSAKEGCLINFFFSKLTLHKSNKMLFKNWVNPATGGPQKSGSINRVAILKRGSVNKKMRDRAFFPGQIKVALIIR